MTRRRLLLTVDAVGGVWQYTLELAAALRPRGWDTVLALLGPAASRNQRAAAVAAGARLVDTGLALDWLAPDAAAVAAVGAAVAALARAERVELVQLNQPALAAGFAADVPLVVAVHSCVATWWDAVRGGALPGNLAWQADLAMPGKIEVIEFFWYECPFCNAFEPALEAWSMQLPKDVVLHRVPVRFNEEPYTAQQRLYYALEITGLAPTLHSRVFYAIHHDHLRLRSPEDISAFMLQNGVDPMKFMSVYGSFAVDTRLKQARELAAAYDVEAVPAMGVQGRFFTNGRLANAGSTAATPERTNEQMLVVVDALVDRIRRNA